MKKILLLSLTVILSFGLTKWVEAASSDNGSTVITLKIGSSTININGQDQPMDAEGSVPVIENEKTLVPLRSIFEALSTEIEWDDVTQTIIGVQGNTEIRLTIGSNKAYKNGNEVYLEVAPKIVNERTMVPLRFVAESLGANVEWYGQTQTIVITQDVKFLTVGDTTVRLKDTQEQVESLLGKADRIDPSSYDFDWHVYNSDYSRFMMVGIKNGVVEALYTNSKGFATGNAKYGGTLPEEEAGVKYYTDKYENEEIHACLIISDNVTRKDVNEEFYRAQELENLDATNAFRVNNGLEPLEYDKTAALTARKHSQDMANKDFFSHTNLEGLSPWDRFKNEGGSYSSSGENISAGRLLGIDHFDGWLNSAGHRKNMLGSFKYLGVGFGHNSSSAYNYYMTQFFFR